MVLLPEVPCTFITPQHSLHHIFPQLLVQSPAPFPVRAVDGAVVVQAIKDEVVHVDPDVPPPVGRVARRVLAAVEEVALGEGADPVGGPQLVFVPQEGEQAAEPRVPGAQQAQRQGQEGPWGTPCAARARTPRPVPGRTSLGSKDHLCHPPKGKLCVGTVAGMDLFPLSLIPSFHT
eukprot:CAMPEP_0194601752 /NCGR_PEP_ID=MMETSP0292-20121207/29211_1 /TAXON_ID=39354 /ORGANISM="Heterosigma akashiwo, Strain CCMP2393" /LENGTH=175 /DNA_ID=CAMNT_0039463803 /DNA_START=427 /DNA_END=950 /DNA_ORIENTATION=+